MKRSISVFTIIIALLIATNLFAAVTVKNMDNTRYDLVLNCGELVTPMFVNPNNTFQFIVEGDGCNLRLLKTGDSVNVRDNDVLVIRNLNLFKK